MEGVIQARIGHKKCVVIDEVQKIPALLDEVHRLIEEQGIRFLLTGSSARKLKSENANMLGGRARSMSFFPLTYFELDRDFDLDKVLRWGTLPRVYLSENPEADLYAYIENYLEKEVKSEGLIRDLRPFSRFLKMAALSSGQMLNYSNLASDSGVSAPTIKAYYQILFDLLMALNWSLF